MSFILLTLTGCDFGSSGNSSSSTSSTSNLWILGQAAPDNNVGNAGDLYLNTASSDIYTKKNGTWAFAGNIRGQVGVKGNQGDKGNLWYTGASNPDPTASLGLEGDFYINTVTSDIFQKQNNLWVIVFNVKGVKGDKGDTGTSGKNGVVWYTGTVSPPPAAITANVSDFYLNTQSGELYRKDPPGWIGPVTIIKGTNGKDGSNGVNGTNGTSGTNGATWISGTGNPVAGAGTVGDLYFEVLSGSVYQKNLSGWGNSISVLKGSTGLTGTPGLNGTNGTAWCSSSSISDPNTQVVPGCPNDGSGNFGDYFLNTTSGDVYNKSTGTTWIKTFTMAVQSAVNAYIATSIANLSVSLQNSVNPPGGLITFLGPNCPTGYVLADGTSYLIAAYPNLATALQNSSSGYIWGSPDSTHFYVPDFRGQFLRGADPSGVADPDYNSRVNRGGSVSTGVGSFQGDQLRNHNHTVSSQGTRFGANGAYPAGFYGSSGDVGDYGARALTTSNVGGNENRPKNAAVLYCIKY